MSTIRDEEPEIQYILNDTKFIFDNFNSSGINDIIYTDQDQTVVLNGEVVLQDDIEQYIINDNQGEFIITNIADTCTEQPTGNNEIVQYVDEDGNITDPSSIIYINGDEFNIENQEFLPQYKITGFMKLNQNSGFESEIVPTEILNLDSLIEDQDHNDFVDLSTANWYQYAVESDDVHLETPALVNNENFIDQNSSSEFVDISTITGKNLLNGQVVSLENYLNRIKKRMKSIPKEVVEKSRPKHNLNAFLNKKLNLGLTVGGKQLIGKIIHVGSKETNDENEQFKVFNGTEIVPDNISPLIEYSGPPELMIENSSDSSFVKNNQVHIQTKLLSKTSDQFQRISKTLSDLMTMDSIKCKVVQKSLQVEVVDKFLDNMKNVTKNVYFISGYMDMKLIPKDPGVFIEEWTFIPDTVRTEHARNNCGKKSQKKYPEVVNLTIITTHHKNKSFIKVMIDSNNLECQHCDRVFNTNQVLSAHINKEHKVCDVCYCAFDKMEALMEHKQMHVESDNLEPSGDDIRNNSFCKEQLFVESSNFYSEITYEGLHNQKSCDVCGCIFNNTTELHAHKQTHLPSGVKKHNAIRYYACDICKRTFSKQWSLQRHVEIHKGTDQVFRCTVCGCCYQYISSLTRHIVQNHVKLQRPALNMTKNGTRITLA